MKQGYWAGWLLVAYVAAVAAAEEVYRAELVFPYDQRHNHAPGIVECPNGDLIASWYRGSGERSADDVAVYGARLRKGESAWSEPFLMADLPGFPDCNTCMMIDDKQRLWLIWPTVIANSWESCITNYLVSENYEKEGCPQWDWQGLILLKPEKFVEEVDVALEREIKRRPGAGIRERLYGTYLKNQAKDKLLQRLGWQPRCKPIILPSGRYVLPLYTDTYSASIMALSDDQGKTWYTSAPLVGFGNIQPTVLRRKDGTLVAYMRENGTMNKIRVSESSDDGLTWGPVTESELDNPGAGVDGVVLKNGHWVMVYNDTIKGRNSLAVALSEDEGKSWPHVRHLEHQESGAFHYPAVIQGADGTIHAIYSYFGSNGKSMKHAAFNESWIRQGK